MSGRGKAHKDPAIKSRRLTPREYSNESTAQTKVKLLESTKAAFANITGTSTPKSETFTKTQDTSMDESQIVSQDPKRNHSQVDPS